MARPTVHLTAPVPAEVQAALTRDFEIVDGPEGADGILVALTARIDDAYLERAGAQLRVVANYAVGVNNIDLDAAAARGVLVTNTPGVLTRATAELAVGLTISLLRRIAEGDRFVRRRSAWEFSLEFMLGASLDGKEFLVVGPGRIGRETARLAEAFGARPSFAGRDDDLPELLRRITEGDRFIRRRSEWEFSLEFMLGASLDGKELLVVGPGRIGRETARLAEAFGARPSFAGRDADLTGLLGSADIVSLHVPLTDTTRHLIDAPALAAMRPSAVLVNVARGPVVDERALVDALRAGGIAGAALDVFEREPEVEEGLLSLENVVMTPHLGSATRATRVAMGMLCVDALRAVLLDGRRPANAVG